MMDTGLACEQGVVKYFVGIIEKKSLSKQKLEKQWGILHKYLNHFGLFIDLIVMAPYII